MLSISHLEETNIFSSFLRPLTPTLPRFSTLTRTMTGINEQSSNKALAVPNFVENRLGSMVWYHPVWQGLGCELD